ncbi:hypothetical protein FXV77_07755 [Sphingobacterium phlebotomi]|uniref:Uncharacterized protein n=1 Tax=Sphingobacterium phlebotomi TaxID=2605433 RepID=A0A5D4HB64_9SPHI|nr:hypothetical protein [Sphingobacterium phlebotomi]TYR37059.1 hypothetical protein FXV77_07755 [Sphingobacterium phlebotomi]
MKRFLMLLMTLGIVYACENSEIGNDQETDRKKLADMRQEILDQIDAIPCENAEDWRPQALGSKACGGPQEYVPYPEAVDESGELLELIEKYTRLEAEYNKKYDVASDCMFVTAPTGVRCVHGKPELFTMAPNP